MKDFKSLNLPPALATALDKMQYATPTPVQAAALPFAMQGRDILGSAQTGTGKTAAFAIPIIARLKTSPRGTALILTPTRELAMQIQEVITKMLDGSRDIRTALVIGGDSMPKQVAELRMRPRIIIGTPGRINDHLTRGSMMLHEVAILVLDETDRMLDMGFAIQLDAILKYLPARRQTLMFSATLPSNIIAMSKKYLSNPERIAMGSTTATATNIKQDALHMAHTDKYAALVKELNRREGSIIVFVRTKHGAQRLADKLARQQHSASAIHGDLEQRQRERVIAAFRDKQHRILVATDIAARGLDIPHIEHVINYDLPQVPEDYIHRIGRTARAGAEGEAICFISPEENDKWHAITKMLGTGTQMPAQQHHRPHKGTEAHKSNGQHHPRKRRRRFRGGQRHGQPQQAQHAN